MEERNLKKAAIEYAKMGIPVFPLRTKGKTPIFNGWQEDATTDVDKVREWWEHMPTANIGMPTGETSGYVVIDVDQDDDKGKYGSESIREWQHEHGQFPDTWTTITGRGGNHLIFRMKDLAPMGVEVLNGVDVRGKGGLVVLPPSIHENGNRYQWEIGYAPDESEISEVNDSVSELLKIADTKQPVGVDGKPKDEKFRLPETVGEGSRNMIMFKFASSLQSIGISDESIEELCQAENIRRFDPAMKPAEVHKCVVSALTFKKGEIDADPHKGELVPEAPQLDYSQKGLLLKTARNIQIIIENDTQLFGKIKYNEFSDRIEVVGQLPWGREYKAIRNWTNADYDYMMTFLETMYNLTGEKKIKQCFHNVTNDHWYNPVQEYLNTALAAYDGKKGHVRSLMPKYINADDTDYNYECLRLFMRGAATRAFRPGTKFDYVLVVYGPQGCGKSRFGRILFVADEWWNDSFQLAIGDNKGAENVQGKWGIELPELASLKKSDIDSVKAFITATKDTYRGAYKEISEDHLRKCVFYGTTNSDQFLDDQTGSRRYLPVEAHSGPGTALMFPEEEEEYNAMFSDIQQAWGEIMSELDVDKPKLTLPKYVDTDLVSIQSKHTVEDPWEGLIVAYLESKNYGDKICTTEIFNKALSLTGTPIRSQGNRIRMIINNALGNEWAYSDSPRKCGEYGKQKYFYKLKDEFVLTSTDDIVPFN